MKISRFILLFDTKSNQQYVNPDFITGIEQKGNKTIVHITTHSFETNTDAAQIYQDIQNNDLLNK